MRAYRDTGAFIDYLSGRGNPAALLRTTDRRGRTPANIAADAERLFEKVGRTHSGAVSCLTYYEIERRATGS